MNTHALNLMNATRERDYWRARSQSLARQIVASLVWARRWQDTWPAKSDGMYRSVDSMYPLLFECFDRIRIAENAVQLHGTLADDAATYATYRNCTSCGAPIPESAHSLNCEGA